MARRLLRTNLSDLAAKAAEPWLWWLTVAWPDAYGPAERAAFAAGLAHDQALYGLSPRRRRHGAHSRPADCGRHPGGARAPLGATVRRSGARPGDLLLVSGTIGDAGLGLDVLTGAWAAPREDADALVARHRLPEPRLRLRDALRAHASAAADDVSDGLLADAGRIGVASGVSVELALDRLPLSGAARRWVEAQAAPRAGPRPPRRRR